MTHDLLHLEITIQDNEIGVLAFLDTTNLR
jgi:hypothetical protein